MTDIKQILKDAIERNNWVIENCRHGYIGGGQTVAKETCDEVISSAKEYNISLEKQLLLLEAQ